MKKLTKMKKEIIEKVFIEFESNLSQHNQTIEIPVLQENYNWDLEDSFHYSIYEGLCLLIKNECTDISRISHFGSRAIIVIEYKRKNKGGNQPQRKIYVGELIDANNTIITIKGQIITYSEYCNSIDKYENVIKKLQELDDFKKVFVERMQDFLHER